MAELPINEKPYYGTDSIANAISSDDMWDCVMEMVPGVGNITRRRPGLKTFCDLGTETAGDGLYWWDAKQKLVAVSGGRMFLVNADGTHEDVTGAELQVGTPVVFSAGTDHTQAPCLYAANGSLVYLREWDDEAVTNALALQTRSTELLAVITDCSDQANIIAQLCGTVTRIVETMASSLVTDITRLTDAVTAAQAARDKAVADWKKAKIRWPSRVKHYAQLKHQALIDLTQAQNALTAAQDTSDKNIVTATEALTAAIPSLDDVTALLKAAVAETVNDVSAALASGIDMTLAFFTQVVKAGETALTDATAVMGRAKDIADAANKLVDVADVLPVDETLLESVKSVVVARMTNIESLIAEIAGQIGEGTDAKEGVDEMQISAGFTTFRPTDIDTPAATHVAWLNEKFIANVTGTNQFLSTDVDDQTGYFNNTFWSGANNPIVAGANGQKLNALMVAWSQVYAASPGGIQIYQENDGFVNIPGAFIEAGLEAPYTFCRGNNAIYALCVVDGKRAVVMIVSSTPKIISEPIDRVLAELPRVDDAVGNLVSVGGLALYVLQFPTAGQTWVYDIKYDAWYRWGKFDAETGRHGNFGANHSCYVKAWNRHLMMSTTDGKIFELDRNTFEDVDGALVSYRRTGWIDHGIAWNRKRSNQLHIKLKVFAKGATKPVLLMRWRDDGAEDWSPYMELQLAPNQQGDCTIRLNRMGMYRMRQYEFRISDPVDLALVAADEVVQGLSS